MDNDTNSETISDLKFICKIKKGEKINIRYRFVQQDDMLTKISRTFYYKDNRMNTILFITTTIMKCFEIITNYRKSSLTYDKEMVKNIIIDLNSSITGITNIKETYCDDANFGCKLDTLIQDMRARLLSITEENRPHK
jgi:hypothetical protein